jgi:hypothetical protein
MDSSLTLDQEVTLSNEFASVSVKLTERAGRPYLKITDVASGRVTELDPTAALFISQEIISPASERLDATMEIDGAANGPRLKVTESRSGRCIYLDPLELSDAALSGVWGKLPPAYDTTDVVPG